MKASNTLIAAAVTALLAGTAMASDNDEYGNKDKMSRAGATFDSLDANRDGRISRTEASADTTIVFATADANGDGYLDNGEFKKAVKSGKQHDDSSMPPQQPQSSPTPDSSGQPEPTAPQDQSAPPPSDTETPRQ